MGEDIRLRDQKSRDRRPPLAVETLRAVFEVDVDEDLHLILELLPERECEDPGDNFAGTSRSCGEHLSIGAPTRLRDRLEFGRSLIMYARLPNPDR